MNLTRRADAPAQWLESEPALSPHLAFVVQFRVGSGTEAEYFAGRVEHMVSGREARFHTRQELLAFVLRVLQEGQASKGGDAP